jgi:hypothetical protein
MTMGHERTTALVLMDLWAFAYGQDRSLRTRREFETACRMAERLGLPEARQYRAFVESIEAEGRGRSRSGRASREARGRAPVAMPESLLPN